MKSLCTVRSLARIVLIAFAAATLGGCCFHHGHCGWKVRFCPPVHCR